MARQINALIVDDSTTTRKMVMKALDLTGLAKFAFTEAEDGLDALEKYRDGDTDIVFVDMNMPRMGGLEFIRELHTRHRTCPPAVMLTAETDKERLLEALNETGVDAFLLKPVDRDRLRTGLKALVDSIPEREGPSIVPHGECVPQALQEVVASVCNLELTRVPPDEEVRSGEVVFGMASVLGEIQWSLVLGFARDTAREVASSFAGSEVPLDDEDMADAIGEITNMVGGRIKTHLSSRGVAVTVSLPTVIGASALQVLMQRRRKSTADYVHFDSPAGKLWTVVTVGLHAGMVL